MQSAVLVQMEDDCGGVAADTEGKLRTTNGLASIPVSVIYLRERDDQPRRDPVFITRHYRRIPGKKSKSNHYGPRTPQLAAGTAGNRKANAYPDAAAAAAPPKMILLSSQSTLLNPAPTLQDASSPAARPGSLAVRVLKED